MTAIGITGMGVFAPTGRNLAEFWASQLEGNSRIRPSERFSPDGLRSNMVQELSEEELGALAAEFDPGGNRDPFCHVAIAAVSQALGQARLRPSDLGRTGLFIASSSIGWWSGEAAYSAWTRSPHEPTWRRDLCRANHAAIGASIAERFGIGGALQIMSAACASGGIAIEAAVAQMRVGRLDRAIVCGADLLARVPLSGFNALRMVSQDCCRPFSRDRKGIILAEGAAALVLEPVETSRQRGATSFATVASAACGCDADHMTRPAVEGISRTMRKAIAAADVALSEFGLVSAHGTGTKVNDAAEAAAIQEVFAERAPSVPVTAIKSTVGHMQGAAGVFAALSTTLSLATGRIPAIANFAEADPGVCLDLVTSERVEREIGTAIVNAFGFGGVSSTVVLRHEAIQSDAGPVFA